MASKSACDSTEEMAFPSPALMASKSACDSTPLASIPSMALTWALAASCNAPPSMAAPMTIILSTAFSTSCADCPGMGLENRSDVQSTSLISGYAAAESLAAAESIAGLDGAEAEEAVMGLAFTTLVNSINAWYAAFASCSFTVDMRYAGTLSSTKAPTEL